jgi:hypothetical protein
VGKNTFLKEIKTGAQIGILFLVSMGFFEYLTGIHLAGKQTEKIVHDEVTND